MSGLRIHQGRATFDTDNTDTSQKSSEYNTIFSIILFSIILISIILTGLDMEQGIRQVANWRTKMVSQIWSNSLWTSRFSFAQLGVTQHQGVHHKNNNTAIELNAAIELSRDL